jgi:putative phage-type endonuclease
MMDAKHRKQWLAARRQFIGGSDAAAIMGVSKWRTPLDVYLSKVEGVDGDGNAAMERGRLLEPAVLQMYANETGLALEIGGDIRLHAALPFVGATLDALAAATIVVDAKTSRNRGGWGEPGTDEIPIDYLLQLHHYMAVADKQVADCAVLFGNFDFVIYRCPRDEELVAMLLEAEARFWHCHVLAKQPPPPRSAADALRRFPKARSQTARLATYDAVVDLNDLAKIAGAVAVLEQWRGELEARVKLEIGDALALASGSEPLCTWSNVAAAERLDAARLKAELPDVFKQYAKRGEPTRRFSIRPDAIAAAAAQLFPNPTLAERTVPCLPTTVKAE